MLIINIFLRLRCEMLICNISQASRKVKCQRVFLAIGLNKSPSDSLVCFSDKEPSCFCQCSCKQVTHFETDWDFIAFCIDLSSFCCHKTHLWLFLGRVCTVYKYVICHSCKELGNATWKCLKSAWIWCRKRCSHLVEFSDLWPFAALSYTHYNNRGTGVGSCFFCPIQHNHTTKERSTITGPVSSVL